MVIQKSYGHVLTMITDAKVEASINALLLDIGFSVTHARSTIEIKEAFLNTDPDLVIGDLENEVDTGLHFLSEFCHQYPDIPIITLIEPNSKNVLKTLRHGAWDCLEKPVKDLRQLEHSVCKALERSRLVNENKQYRYKLEQMNEKLQISLFELKQDQIAGKTVQEQMFPKEDLIVGQYNFSHYIQPSLFLSGDMIDYFEISDQHVGFYIADVSGHGASSAFVTVMIKALFDQLLLSYKQDQNEIIFYPKKVLSLLNEYLKRASLGKYATLIYGVLDIKTHKLKLSVAGHYPGPILASAEGTQFIQIHAFAVGMIEKVTYKEEIIDFPESSTLGIFSDGLLEVMPGITLEDKETILLETLKPSTSIIDLIKQFDLINKIENPDDITMLLIGRSHEKN